MRIDFWDAFLDLIFCFHPFIVIVFLRWAKFSRLKSKILFGLSLLFLFYSTQLYWLLYTTYYVRVALLVFTLCAIYLLPFILFEKKSTLFIASWLLIDYANLTFGFPILIIGHKLAYFNIFLSIAPYTGILGLSLVILFLNYSLIKFAQQRKSKFILFIYLLSLTIWFYLLKVIFGENIFVHKKKINIHTINTHL